MKSWNGSTEPGRSAKFKLSQQAASYLKRLDRVTRQRINDALLDAFEDPIGASDHLMNRGQERKVRVGSLRVLFRIVDDEILIDTILPRGEVYKHSR
ncbi:MAG: type II toxin-antitoxin system RelE/ParE family toxin [Acidobacteriaceae bacterium]|nr:type II toxin-antitoxin system RelE/ParE family toxin [Acidobacteriaceae bacterium]